MRAFSLIEVMTSLVVAGLIGSATVGVFTVAIREGGDSGAEWQATSIAEQNMEKLAALPKTSGLLADVTPDVEVIGSVADRSCASGVDGKLSSDMLVDDLGRPSSTGRFTLCWKNTLGSPIGTLINTRVIVTYHSRVGPKAVMLQTLR